jgi:hypothetical protein
MLLHSRYDLNTADEGTTTWQRHLMKTIDSLGYETACCAGFKPVRSPSFNLKKNALRIAFQSGSTSGRWSIQQLQPVYAPPPNSHFVPK